VPRAHRLPLVVFALVVAASSAKALPALQLGPGAGIWSYDVGTGTWVTPDNPLQLLAFANATPADGGNGGYAWTTTGTGQIAYLVISAVPKNTGSEPPSLFDVTLDNDAATLSLYTSGNGAPPLSDPNDLTPHGIFDTYFEIYEFNFDGSLVGITNTQTGFDPAQGYQELFDVTIDSLDSSVQFLHFDVFTIQGSGQLGPTDQVFANAPFTHDAQTVPEPGTAALLGLGLAGFAAARRRR